MSHRRVDIISSPLKKGAILIFRCLAAFAVCYLFYPMPVVSEDKIASRPVIPHPGLVIWWGGGDVPTAVLERFTKGASGKTVAIVADRCRVPVALQNWAKESHHAIEFFSPGISGIAEKLLAFDAVWIDAEEPSEEDEILDSLLVSNDFLQHPPPDALIAKLTTRPGLIGVGIPSGTALIANGRRLEFAGMSDVVFCLPASTSRPNNRPLKQWRRKPGSDADLIELNRSAIARLGPVFPAERDNVPEVPAGVLFPCGGGDLPDSLWQRFVDLAGGVDSPFVVIPIATPQPDDPAPKGVDRLKRLGCRHITVLNQHTEADVRTPQFVEALKEARGVWFVGGRQWKYIDAYEGGIAEQLFRDVLKRNGVIGGTSAGAAAQSEYMVRGSPLGNREIMAEGYEHGLNFLPGCAIDIHVKQRGRLNDLVGLIQFYPQLLGIGIDEDTAAEIRGRVLTVHGDGRVNIVDSRVPVPTALQAGDRFDLVERKPLK